MLISFLVCIGFTGAQRFDVVVNARIDVLFTHTVPAELYAKVATRRRDDGQHLVVVPRWAGFGGVNDRFQMGSRDAVLRIMRRIDNVTSFVEAGVKPVRRTVKVGQLHSESYLKWFWEKAMGFATEEEKDDAKGKERNRSGGATGILYRTRNVRFRRVRASGLLDTVGYVGRDKKCALDTMPHCTADLVAKVGVCRE